MRASAVLRFRATASVLATLEPPQLYNAGNIGRAKLTSLLKDTSSWSSYLVGTLGCELVASTPSKLNPSFEAMDLATLPPRLQSLLRFDTEADNTSRSISKWLATLPEYSGERFEPAVDRIVGEVLHACDLDDGRTTQLLVQRPLEFSIGDLAVTSIPDHSLHCGRLEDNKGLVNVVAQSSKPVDGGPKEFGWGPLVGGLVAAGVSNMLRAPNLTPPPAVYGIRVVQTRWTFLRADFTAEYLRRLVDYELLPDDRFNVAVWGSLNYTVAAERADIIRMVTALGLEAKGLARKAALL